MSDAFGIAREMDELARDLRRKPIEAAYGFMAHLRGSVLAQSSGPFSSRWLASKGHPYRHGGSPPMDPAFINQQRGVFKSYWVFEVQRTADSITVHAHNVSDVAKYLEHGTPSMISRPFAERQYRVSGPVFEQMMAKAIGT